MIDFDARPTVDPSSFRQTDRAFPGHWRTNPVPWPHRERLDDSDELRPVLEDAIAVLPSQQRVVITLRDIAGLDAGEVSDLLDVTVASQRALLHRARAAVRAALARHFEDADS